MPRQSKLHILSNKMWPKMFLQFTLCDQQMISKNKKVIKFLIPLNVANVQASRNMNWMSRHLHDLQRQKVLWGTSLKNFCMRFEWQDSHTILSVECTIMPNHKAQFLCQFMGTALALLFQGPTIVVIIPARPSACQPGKHCTCWDLWWLCICKLNALTLIGSSSFWLPGSHRHVIWDFSCEHHAFCCHSQQINSHTWKIHEDSVLVTTEKKNKSEQHPNPTASNGQTNNLAAEANELAEQTLSDKADLSWGFSQTKKRALQNNTLNPRPPHLQHCWSKTLTKTEISMPKSGCPTIG